ncbi:MAG: hypothetical protein ACE5DL_00245 [Nitrosopumilaceae archaeon]
MSLFLVYSIDSAYAVLTPIFLCCGDGTADGEFEGNTDMNFDRQNNMYVADLFNDRIQKFNSTFNHIQNLDMKCMIDIEPGDICNDLSPIALTFDEQGNIYAAASIWPSPVVYIVKFNSQGVFQGYAGPCYDGPNCNSDLQDGISENNYSVGFTCTKLLCDTTDTFEDQTPKINPSAIFSGAWDIEYHGGFLYVLPNTTASFIEKIKLDDATKVGTIPIPNDSNGIQKFEIDKYGNFWAVDRTEHRIIKFDKNGVELFTIGSWCTISNGQDCVDPDGPGPLELGDGEFFNPEGITFDSLDNFYVTDTWNDRIQKFNSTGDFLDKGSTINTRPSTIVSDLFDNIIFNENRSSQTYDQNLYILATDTDLDGLFDDWEENGIDFDNDGMIDFDLPGLFPVDKNHKDMLIEIDYMENHMPMLSAISNVVTAFANAPVSNPDNMDGINLHVVIDDEVPHQDNIDVWSGFDSIKNTYFGTNGEDPKTKSAKKLVFRYALFAHQYDNDTSSGVAEINGNDFIVSLGASGWTSSSGHNVGSRMEQESTFMHELGHTLGLYHGGEFPDLNGDGTITDAEDGANNCKPNYLSVMSYSRAFSYLIPDRPLDYSRNILAPIDENNLNEITGTGANTPPGAKAFWDAPINQTHNRAVVAPAGTSMDFNIDGDATDTGFSQNLNKIGWISKHPCNNNNLKVLNGFDDWANIKINFRNDGQSADGVHFPVPWTDLTDEQISVMLDDFTSSCGVPDSGDWIINQTCSLTSNVTAPANVVIQNNSLLTIPNGITLTINSGNNLTIKSGSGAFLQSGTIQVNP